MLIAQQIMLIANWIIIIAKLIIIIANLIIIIAKKNMLLAKNIQISILWCQPSACSFEGSVSLRIVPSGLLLSKVSLP